MSNIGDSKSAAVFSPSEQQRSLERSIGRIIDVALALGVEVKDEFPRDACFTVGDDNRSVDLVAILEALAARVLP